MSQKWFPASTVSIRSMKLVNSKSLQSLNMGEPLCYQDIPESLKDYLEGCNFKSIHFFKSKLSCSFSEKILRSSLSLLDYASIKIVELGAFILSTCVEQAILHHLELILQGKKGNKNILVLLSYGADGLEQDTKSYTNNEDRNKKINLIINRRKNNFYVKTIQLKEIKGTLILQFLKNYFRDGQLNIYNLATNNCHKFVYDLTKDALGSENENLKEVKNGDIQSESRFQKLIEEIKCLLFPQDNLKQLSQHYQA